MTQRLSPVCRTRLRSKGAYVNERAGMGHAATSLRDSNNLFHAACSVMVST